LGPAELSNCSSALPSTAAGLVSSSVMASSPGVGRPTSGVAHADDAIGQHLGVHAAAPVGVEGLLQPIVELVHQPTGPVLTANAQTRRTDDQDATTRVHQVQA